jgi:glucose/arabinose dehydrogenase
VAIGLYTEQRLAKIKTRRMAMKLARAALLLSLAASAGAQVNVGEQKPEAAQPFNMTTTATFELPWRIAFLPDGRMLVTEKIGPIWLVSPEGEKIAPLAGTPPVYWQGQNGMLGVFLSPHYATDQNISSPISNRVIMAGAVSPRQAEHQPPQSSTGRLQCAVAPDAQGQRRPGRCTDRFLS